MLSRWLEAYICWLGQWLQAHRSHTAFPSRTTSGHFGTLRDIRSGRIGRGRVYYFLIRKVQGILFPSELLVGFCSLRLQAFRKSKRRHLDFPFNRRLDFPFNFMQFRAISCNFVQFVAISCNFVQFVAICDKIARNLHEIATNCTKLHEIA